MGEAVKSIRDRMVKFYAKDDNTITLNATPGHFATSSSHINFYIDVTRLKVRANEAREAARSIKNKMLHHVTTVDTIVCMDGTEVLGAYLEKDISQITTNMRLFISCLRKSTASTSCFSVKMYVRRSRGKMYCFCWQP